MNAQSLHFLAERTAESCNSNCERHISLDTGVQLQQKLEVACRFDCLIELDVPLVDVMKSVHKECENDMDWNEVLQSQPPFVKGQPGPREVEAQKALDSFKPGLFGGKSKREQLETELANAKKADEAAQVGANVDYAV